MTQTALPSRITFVTCLLAAPAVFGLLTGLFVLGGEYLARFGFVGRLGLLLCLPAWLTVFAWLAWRAAKRGETGVRPYVFASIGANMASLSAYPLIILASEALGGGLADTLHEAMQGAEAGDEELSLTAAALFAGVIVFFIGLFFMPLLGALFGWLAGRLGLVKRPAPAPGEAKPQ